MNLSHVSTEHSMAMTVIHTTKAVALAIMVKRPGHRTQLPAQLIQLVVVALLRVHMILSLWAKTSHSQL